jgi:hypothetical protein
MELTAILQTMTAHQSHEWVTIRDGVLPLITPDPEGIHSIALVFLCFFIYGMVSARQRAWAVPTFGITADWWGRRSRTIGWIDIKSIEIQTVCAEGVSIARPVLHLESGKTLVLPGFGAFAQRGLVRRVEPTVRTLRLAQSAHRGVGTRL